MISNGNFLKLSNGNNAFYIKNVLRNLYRDKYFITLLAALIAINIIFYHYYPSGYLEFLITEAIFFLLLATYNQMKKSYRKVEHTRLLTIEQLEKRYKRKVEDENISAIYEKVKNLRITNNGIWVPGDAIDYIDGKNVYLKPIYKQIEGEMLLKKIMEPIDDYFKEIFNSQPYLWNELNAKPIAAYEKDGKYIIEVVPVSYYDYFVANLSCDAKINARKSLRDLLEFYVLANKNESVFRQINEELYSPIPNPLSILLLIMSKDGYLILPKRSSKVASEKEVYGNTVAGTIDWKYLNIIANKDEEINIYNLLYQEIYEKEEVSIKENAKERYILYPFAIIRNLRHLGEPSLFFVGVVNDNIDNFIKMQKVRTENDYISFFKLREPFSEREFSNKDELKTSLLKSINNFGISILSGNQVEGFKVRTGSYYKKKFYITHNQISSTLLIELYSIWKYFNRHYQ